MRIVIVGIGDVGRELAENLTRRENNELVLIDIDEKHCEQLAGALDALVLHGDGTDPALLKKARLTEADALVATTGSDAINTVIAMLGHLSEVPKIIVKLNGRGLRAACQEIGITEIVAPKIAAAARIQASLYGFSRLDFSLVARGGLRLVELEVGKAFDKRLADLNFPDGALVVSVLRDEQVLIPQGKTRLEAGDILLTLIQNEAVLKTVRQLLDSAD